MTDSYDQVAYQGFPFPESHPDRLCIIGRLLGMDPARPLAAASSNSVAAMAAT